MYLNKLQRLEDALRETGETEETETGLTGLTGTEIRLLKKF